MINFEADNQPIATDDNLSKITDLAVEHQQLNEQLERIEKVAKDTKAAIRRIAENDIPNIMEECGMTEFKTANLTVTIKPILEASIPTPTGIARAKDDMKRFELESRREACFNWLHENDGDGIIKNEFAFALPKGTDSEKLDELKEFAEEIKLPFSHDTKVHAGTLKSFIKEKLANGADVPFDAFGIYIGKVAKIK